MDVTSRELIEYIRRIGQLVKKKFAHKNCVKGVHEVTMAQMYILGRVFENGRMKMGDLARSEGVKLPTMTSMVNKLVKNGLLIRESDEKDRRTVWISVSGRTKKEVLCHLKEMDGIMGKLLDVLSGTEKKQAVKMLVKMNDYLERMV
ncbi:MAG TPA: MarR family transcriptional regulator [Candidatus Goldiibacteriota bacterium]|nr:MarR family transcriptional regulator [Candidatus Goldiibacteriota bacterium]HRQ42911.1 MarR family transcriptional regulator [Candidatus Goldiibacteriota bacterium]